MRDLLRKVLRRARGGSAARAKKLLQTLVYGSIDTVVAHLPKPDAVGGVLVVRLDNIGDFILWLRAATGLRTLFPGQRIVLAANATWASLAQQLPYWDEVISIDLSRLKGNPLYRFRTFLAMRRRGFSVAVQPNYSRLFFLGDAVVRVSGARERIGADGDLSNMSSAQKRIADQWYTRLVDPGGPALTEIEHNEWFSTALGGTIANESDYRLPRVATLPEELRLDRPYFVVFPGASWTGRRWPEASFAQVIDATCKTHDWLPVLCGSPDEFGLCDAVAAQSEAATINLAGRTSLAEFCEVVRNAELLVGNDTSAIHIAAVVGTPSVCIFGGGHFGRFLPYPASAGALAPVAVFERMPCFGCGFHCYMPHVDGQALPCVGAVSVAAVRAAMERVQASDARRHTVESCPPRQAERDASTRSATRHGGFERSRDGDA